MSLEQFVGFKVKDFYYKKAKKEKFLARSIYKLEEIDQRYKVLGSGDLVLDLGYYPGSWIQYTSKKVGKQGRVVGVDIQEIQKQLLPLGNVTLFHTDAFKISSLEDLDLAEPFQVVLSDMAPSTTGMKSVDQARSCELVEKVFSLLPTVLGEGGNLVVKVFDGNDVQTFLKTQKKSFNEFQYLRPKSTRTVSKEFFVIGKGYKG